MRDVLRTSKRFNINWDKDNLNSERVFETR
jgi:hypothetical protein